MTTIYVLSLHGYWDFICLDTDREEALKRAKKLTGIYRRRGDDDLAENVALKEYAFNESRIEDMTRYLQRHAEDFKSSEHPEQVFDPEAYLKAFLDDPKHAAYGDAEYISCGLDRASWPDEEWHFTGLKKIQSSRTTYRLPGCKSSNDKDGK